MLRAKNMGVGTVRKKENMEILLCHDANEDIRHPRMVAFYEKTSLVNIYQQVNQIENDDLP